MAVVDALVLVGSSHNFVTRPSIYVRGAKELWARRKNFALLLTTASCQAVAHASLAWCAALATRALAGERSASEGYAGVASWVVASPLTLCAVAFGAAVIKTAAGAMGAHVQRRVVAAIGASVRARVVESLFAGAAGRAHAATTAALSVRTRDLERGLSEGLIGGGKALLYLSMLLVALVAFSAELSFFALFGVVPFAVALSAVRRRLKRTHAEASKTAERLEVEVDELVRHVDLWRAFGANDRIRRRLAEAEEQAALASARVETTRTTLSGANEALAALALAALWLLVAAGVAGADAAAVLPFSLVLFLAYKPLRDLGDARAALDQGDLALLALDTLTSTPASAPDTSPLPVSTPTSSTPATATPTTASGAGWPLASLRVRGLVLARDGQPLTGAPLALDAEPGEIVAVVGPTGAGKTTLIRTLLGLERAASGRIEYAGVDLTSADVGPASRPFAWVPQEGTLVTGTLEDNVCLAVAEPRGDDGDEEAAATIALARRALAAVGASTLSSRASGVHLAAGARDLSGGERKWVALARAVASACPVILMDEPTAGLDAHAEREVLAAMSRLREGRILVVVTHHAGPLALADRVVHLPASG